MTSSTTSAPDPADGVEPAEAVGVTEPTGAAETAGSAGSTGGTGTAGGAGAEPSGFADLGLRPELLTALTALGYEEPTPVQREAVPHLLAGSDLVGQAATGTGKTAAFALPLLQRLPEGPRGPNPSALVLAPTRELAVQVAEATERYGAGLGARVLAVYGGQAIGPQLSVLRRGVDVVVATPGRALDHLSRHSLVLDDLRTVVLDEADEMLDMGFAEDIEAILSATPTTRQTVLFSATLPPRIDRIARTYLTDPVRLTVAREVQAAGEAPRVRQVAHVVARAYKAAALRRVLDVEAPAAAIVFCRSRGEVDELTELLNGRGARAEALHGGMGQDQRDRVVARLRAGTAQLLVATDVAARGLDVDHLSHVVNYDVPAAPDSYVHRVGRVGRAGRDGVAITLAEPREQRALSLIERATGQAIDLLPLPSVADLRAARAERSREAVRGVLGSPELDRYRAVVTDLADASAEHDAVDVAAAALLLLARSSGGEGDEMEIPSPTARPVRGGTRAPGGSRGEGRRTPATATPAGPARPPVRGRTGRGGGDTTRLWVGLGRTTGVRPQDLVGAIANESSLSGRDIGAIQVSERYSLVEVPEGAADGVVEALRGSIIRGRRATVRREREDRRG